MSNAENAVIIIYDKGGKAKDTLKVQYNPSEYSLESSAKYAVPKAKTSQDAKQEYINEESDRLSFKLTIDGFTKNSTDDESEAANVSEDVQKLKSLLKIDGDQHKPPECEFKWGGLEFRGVMDKLSVRYTMFSSNGKPIRAALDVSIVQTKTMPTVLNSPDRTKRRVLPQDTELYMVANEEYDSPEEWRPIAIANGIKNPRIVETGVALRLPPLEDAQ